VTIIGHATIKGSDLPSDVMNVAIFNLFVAYKLIFLGCNIYSWLQYIKLPRYMIIIFYNILLPKWHLHRHLWSLVCDVFFA
jgi:hypothetical protein